MSLHRDIDYLHPLIPHIPGTLTKFEETLGQPITVSSDEYDHHVLLQIYDNWVAGDVKHFTSPALDGLGRLDEGVLGTYEARSPWLRLYIDARLARPTREITDIIWHDGPAFEAITNIRIRDYEDGKLAPEPALLELFSHSRSLETNFRLFSLLIADPELARIVPDLTDQLVSRISTTFFVRRFQTWSVRELETYLFLMETIHPQWGTLSPEWRSAFAREFLAIGSNTYLKEVLELLETYFEQAVQHRLDASGTPQPLPQDSAGTTTEEPIPPVEKGGEPQTGTLRDTIHRYHGKWKTAASAYLPFLANVLQEAPEHITEDVVEQIRELFPRLPDYFGDESTRSMIFDALGRRERMMENVALFKGAWEGSELIS